MRSATAFMRRLRAASPQSKSNSPEAPPLCGVSGNPSAEKLNEVSLWFCMQVNDPRVRLTREICTWAFRDEQGASEYLWTDEGQR